MGVALLAVLGVGNGYVAVVMITVVQRMTPTAMLGRVMSLVMLAMLGVTPLSQVVAGAVVKLGPVVLFVGCGAGMLAVAAVAAVCRRSWSLDALESPARLRQKAREVSVTEVIRAPARTADDRSRAGVAVRDAC